MPAPIIFDLWCFRLFAGLWERYLRFDLGIEFGFEKIIWVAVVSARYCFGLGPA
jgi:hypothetical protein